MEQDPEKINDADRLIESKILEAGEAYAASNKRQKVENKGRAENRAKLRDLGIGTYAYQVAVKVCKDFTESERADFLRDLEMLVRVLGPKQRDFFEDEMIKAEKRAQREADKKAKEGRTQEELDAATDANPKSDPAAGGAGKKRGRKPKADKAIDIVSQSGVRTEESDLVPETGDELIARVAREENEKLEQRTGAAILDTAGKPKSQSQIAAEKLEAAKLA